MSRSRLAASAGLWWLGAWTALGALTAVVLVHRGAPLFTDAGLLSWSVHHRPTVAVAVGRGITATGTGVFPYLLAVSAGLLAGRTRRRRWYAVLLCVACLALGQALRAGLMTLVARPRPPGMFWETSASGWAFPSGHTTTSAVAAGLLVIALRARRPSGGRVLVVAVACWAVLVGLTRVYLGVHWSTDVVGGWLFALGWLGLCRAATASAPAERLARRWSANGP
ncbi:phosphatase PAP2 family protein [Streptomyces sp. NPDC048566]|uniref:phosphatase PAP2 family protein n=1 Tax=Streptomyces sp. NPDC048566 TaxID=3365569 RepID=UPI0037126576